MNYSDLRKSYFSWDKLDKAQLEHSSELLNAAYLEEIASRYLTTINSFTKNIETSIKDVVDKLFSRMIVPGFTNHYLLTYESYISQNFTVREQLIDILRETNYESNPQSWKFDVNEQMVILSISKQRALTELKKILNLTEYNVKFDLNEKNRALLDDWYQSVLEQISKLKVQVEKIDIPQIKTYSKILWDHFFHLYYQHLLTIVTQLPYETKVNSAQIERAANEMNRNVDWEVKQLYPKDLRFALSHLPTIAEKVKYLPQPTSKDFYKNYLRDHQNPHHLEEIIFKNNLKERFLVQANKLIKNQVREEAIALIKIELSKHEFLKNWTDT